MPTLPWFPCGFSLYLKSDLMLDVVVSCCSLETCKGTSLSFWHWPGNFPEAGVGDSKPYSNSSSCVFTCYKWIFRGSWPILRESSLQV